MTQEVLKLALEALEEADEIEFWNKQKQAITAIKEALAQLALDAKAENAKKLGLDYELENKENT